MRTSTASFFFIITLSNSLLAYMPLGLSLKGLIFLFGIFIPLLFFYRFSADPIPDEELPWKKEANIFSFPQARWIMGIAFIPLLCLRLFILPHWPVPDDGLFSFYSIELTERWRWWLLFDQTQHPPLWNWSLAMFFKWVQPSLVSIRLFPLLISSLAFVASFTAGRFFFSRSLTFLFTFLCGFSFWPFYAGRFCMYMSLLFLWEIGALLAMGFYWTAEEPPKKKIWALVFGIVCAGGFWLAIAWPLVALTCLPVVYQSYRMDRGFKSGELSLFLFPLALSAFLYADLSLGQGNGEHFRYLWAFNSGSTGREQISASLSNISAILWGCDLKNSYGPVWGGMLNPVLGSSFLMGLVVLVRSRRNAISVWILSACFTFLLPGLFSKGFDIFRISPLLPVLLAVTAIGLQNLTLSLQPSRRRLIIAGLLILSTGLDMLHLWKTFNVLSPSSGANISPQSSEWSRAYSLLEKKNRQEGPGQLFLELQQGIGDQTLNVTTYSFNAAENPSLNPEEAHWAALLCNIHYKPFLASRFPDGKWYWLGKDEAWNYGGLMLGIIPIHEENKAVFKKWNVVNLKFREVTSLILHSSLYGPKDYIVRELLKSKQLVTGDPFLESCLHERLLFSLKMGGPIDPLIIIQDELKLGYPLPTFLCAEGILLSARGDFAEAKAAFQKAARSPLNLTPAADYLKALGSMPKSRPKALSSGIISAFP